MLQFSGGVGFFSLVEGSGSATDDELLTLADLSQYCTEASGGGVCVEPESLAKIQEGSDGAGRRRPGIRRSSERPRLSWLKHVKGRQ